jgi:hypothetical protein
MKPKQLTLSVVAAVALTVLGAPVANANIQPNVTCGQVISQSITLNADLTCPSTEAIGVSGGLKSSPPVVFDLGGHTLTGTGPTPGSAVLRDLTLIGSVQNGRIVGGVEGEESIVTYTI